MLIFHTVQKLKDEAKILRLFTTEKRNMYESITGLSKCSRFVNGNKQNIFCPRDGEEQGETCDGQHRINCHAALLWTDIRGSIIIIDLTRVGSAHYRKLYNKSDVLTAPVGIFGNGHGCPFLDESYVVFLYILGTFWTS